MHTNSTKDIQHDKEIKNARGGRETFSRFLAFIDSTEQQIPRPVDKRSMKIYYSLGKEKRYTAKNQIMVNNYGYIIHKADHRKGKRYDYVFKKYKNNHPTTPKQVVNVVDLGYIGIEKDSSEQLSTLPYKKKINQDELPQEEEKEYNKIHSKKKRIVIGHTIICRLKKYRIMSDMFRNKPQKV